MLLDVFPPEIDAAAAILRCADKTFPTSQDALDCFGTPGLVSAVDDCKQVDLTFEDKDASSCSAIIGIKATAMGCENRTNEDTTEIDVPVAIDSEKPEVTCKLGTQNLEGKGYRKLVDLDFSFTASDKCTDSDDLAVTIEVLSNEKVAAGDAVSHIPNLLQLLHSSTCTCTFTQNLRLLSISISIFVTLQNLDGGILRAVLV